MKTQEKDNFFDEIANLLPQIICIVDNKGNITYVNKIGFEKFGYTPKDLNKGLNVLQMLVAEDRDRAMKNILRNLKREKFNGIEYTALRKDGTTFPILVYTNLIIRENKPIGLRAIVIDITERKKTEQKLKESEEKFRTITEQSLVGIAIIQDDEIKYANEQLLELTGYAMDEIREWGPQGFARKIHPDDRTFIMEQAIKKQKGLKDVIDRYEMRIIKKNGEIVWLDNYSKTISYEGRPADLAILVDISKQKQLIKICEESEEKYRLMSENARDVMGVLNKDFEIEYVNEQAVLNLLNYTLEDVIGKSGVSFVHPDDVERAIKSLNIGLKEGQSRMEVRFRHKNGHYIWCEATGRAYTDYKGEIKGAVVIRDITERKKTEKALKESEIKYRRLFEESPNSITLVNSNGIILDINPATEKIYGYTRDEIIGKNYADFGIYTLDQLSLFKKRFFDDLKGKKLKPIELQIHKKDGSSAWINYQSSIIKKDDDIFIEAIAQDITERKISDNALKAVKEFTDNVVNTSIDTIFVFESQTGRAIKWNKAFRDISGYTDDEIASLKAPDSYYSEEDLKRAAKATEKILSEGETTVEMSLITKDGRNIPFEYAARTFKSVDGDLLIVSVGRDMTKRKKKDKDLRESEEKYRNLINNILDEVLETDLDGTITYVSPQVYDLLGYSPDEVIGTNSLTYTHPDDLNSVAEALKTTIKTNEEVKLEFRLLHKDGHYITVSARGNFVKEGDNAKLVAILRDITERKKAEKKIKESEERFRSLVETTSDWIWEVDENGVYSYSSPKVMDLLGYNPKEVIGKTPFDLMRFDEAERISRIFQSIILSQEPFEGLENTNQHKDGQLIMLETSGIPIFDENRNLRGYRGIDRDITDRKKAQMEIEVEKKKLEDIMESMIDGVTICDMNGKIISINKAAIKQHGYTNEEVIGKTPGEIYITKEDLPKFREVLKKLAIGESVRNQEYISKHKGGRLFPTNVNLSVLKDLKGNPTAIIAVHRDITKRKKAEEKLKESEKRYREAYDRANFYKELIAHDMNNLLQTIQSSVELYTMFQNKPEYLKDKRNLLDIITKQVFRGATIVSNIIKLSELEETEISIEPIEVSNILMNAIEFVYKSFQGTQVKIEVDTPGKKLFVKANDLILDLFENLLINAVKHNTNPEIEILVKISEEQKKNINYLKFEFIDNGIGIPDERKDILFQRVHKRNGKVRGLGIGLSLVKQLIDSYNGKIWIENRVKEDYTKGSNFIVLIPKAM